MGISIPKTGGGSIQSDYGDDDVGQAEPATQPEPVIEPEAPSPYVEERRADAFEGPEQLSGPRDVQETEHTLGATVSAISHETELIKAGAEFGAERLESAGAALLERGESIVRAEQNLFGLAESFGSAAEGEAIALTSRSRNLGALAESLGEGVGNFLKSPAVSIAGGALAGLAGGLTQAEKTDTTTEVGRAVDTGLNASLQSAFAIAGGGVSLADTLFNFGTEHVLGNYGGKEINEAAGGGISGNVATALRATTSLGEAIFTGDTAGIDKFNEASLRGDYGVIFQGYSMIGNSDVVRETGAAVIEGAVDAGRVVVAVDRAVRNTITRAAENVYDGARAATTDAIEGAVNVGRTVVAVDRAVRGAVTRAAENVYDGARAATTDAIEGAVNVGRTVVAVDQAVRGAVTRAAENAYDSARNATSNAIEGVANFFKPAASAPAEPTADDFAGLW